MRSRRVAVVMGLLVGLGVMLSAVPASADIYIKSVNHTDSMTIMGQARPASDDTVVCWLTPKNICIAKDANERTVFDADKGMVYLINGETKTYAEIPANWMQSMQEQMATDSAGKAAAEMMNAMMGSIEMTVTPTEEAKKIGTYDTKKYTVAMKMAMVEATTDMWITEIPDVDWEAYYGLNNAMLARFPGFEKAMAEMKKIKGVSVESATSVTMMGQTIKSTGKLLEYSTKDAPAGVFDIPEGYTKTDLPGPMGQ